MASPERKQTPMRLPRSWHRVLKQWAAAHETSLQAIYDEALREWADKHGVKLDENDNASADDGEPQAAA